MTISDVLFSDDFILELCSFLDEFKRNDDKCSMICDEPLIENADKKKLCILAAVAHKLSNDYKIEIPSWVYNKDYYFQYPIYSGGVALTLVYIARIFTHDIDAIYRP